MTGSERTHKPAASRRVIACAALCGLALGNVPVHAQDIAGQPAVNLGRLFLTPAERSQLDLVRNAEGLQVQIEPSEDEQRSTVAPPAAVTMNGYVRRSDGVTTAWVNGISSFDGNPDALPDSVDRRRFAQGRVQITGAEGEPAVQLKPGQTWEPADGSVTDVSPPAP